MDVVEAFENGLNTLAIQLRLSLEREVSSSTSTFARCRRS